MTASTDVCPLKKDEITIKHGLAIIQVAMISAMAIFVFQINNIFCGYQNKYFSPNANTSNQCFSSSFADVFKKFQTYKDLVFYSLIASCLLNLGYMAFQYQWSCAKWIVKSTYALIAAVGIVGMSLSVDGFLKIRSMKNQPAECNDITNKFKTLFIMGIATSVAQAAMSMWVLKDMYIKFVVN